MIQNMAGWWCGHKNNSTTGFVHAGKSNNRLRTCSYDAFFYHFHHFLAGVIIPFAAILLNICSYNNTII
jgi:hypothetical protein